MNKKYHNKQQRQHTRINHKNDTYISQFVHNLNNKLCTLQGTIQINLYNKPEFQQLTNHIEKIIAAISTSANIVSNQVLTRNYKRTKLPRSFFTTN